MSAKNASIGGLATGKIHDLPAGIVALVTNTRQSKRQNVQHHRAKLTAEQVKQMRSEYVPYNVGYGELALRYGCGESTVRDICTYRTRVNVL